MPVIKLSGFEIRPCPSPLPNFKQDIFLSFFIVSSESQQYCCVSYPITYDTIASLQHETHI